MSGDSARRTLLVGWLEAAAFVLCIGIISSVYAAALGYGVNVVALMLHSMTLSGLALLIANGIRGDTKAIALAPLSWVVGLANILIESAYYLLIAWVSPAEASLLVRQALGWSMLVGLVLFGRRVGRLSVVGAAIVLAAVFWLAAVVPAERRWIALAISALCAIAFVTRGYASEFHAHNRAARTLREKMQVTGVVTLVTALGGWVVVLALTGLVGAGLLPPLPAVPRPAELVHLPTITFAVLIGGFIFTAMNYLAFSSVVKIGTDGFVAASTFMPPATLAVQWLAEKFGLIPPQPFDWTLMPAMTIAVAGVMLVIADQRQRSAGSGSE
jgi:drug/metabolite transporter (DMT)-like permease